MFSRHQIKTQKCEATTIKNKALESGGEKNGFWDKGGSPPLVSSVNPGKPTSGEE